MTQEVAGITLKQWLRRTKACLAARIKYEELDPQQAWRTARLDHRVWALTHGWPWATQEQWNTTLDGAVEHWISSLCNLRPRHAYLGITWYWNIPVGSPIGRELHERGMRALALPEPDRDYILSFASPKTRELTRAYLDRNGSNEPIALSTFLGRTIRGSARRWLPKYHSKVRSAIFDLAAAGCVASLTTRRHGVAWVWREDIR